LRKGSSRDGCDCLGALAPHAHRIDILGTDVTAHADEGVFWLTITGRLTGAVALAIVDQFYPQVERRNIVWDMTAARIELTETDLGEIARRAARRLTVVRQRKTACVVGSADAFVPLWKYVNAAFVAGVPAEYSVFVGADKARAWLAQG